MLDKQYDKFSIDYEGRCGNCHTKFDNPDEKYCTYCGTKRGEGKFEPYDNTPYCIYGPMPQKRIRQCVICGHQWSYTAMLDRKKYCSKCGGGSILVDVSYDGLIKY